MHRCILFFFPFANYTCHETISFNFYLLRSLYKSTPSVFIKRKKITFFSFKLRWAWTVTNAISIVTPIRKQYQNKLNKTIKQFYTPTAYRRKVEGKKVNSIEEKTYIYIYETGMFRSVVRGNAAKRGKKSDREWVNWGQIEVISKVVHRASERASERWMNGRADGREYFFHFSTSCYFVLCSVFLPSPHTATEGRIQVGVQHTVTL